MRNRFSICVALLPHGAGKKLKLAIIGNDQKGEPHFSDLKYKGSASVSYPGDIAVLFIDAIAKLSLLPGEEVTLINGQYFSETQGNVLVDAEPVTEDFIKKNIANRVKVSNLLVGQTQTS